MLIERKDFIQLQLFSLKMDDGVSVMLRSGAGYAGTVQESDYENVLHLASLFPLPGDRYEYVKIHADDIVAIVRKPWEATR